METKLLVLNSQKTDYWSDETVATLRKTTKSAARLHIWQQFPHLPAYFIDFNVDSIIPAESKLSQRKGRFYRSTIIYFKAKDRLLTSKLEFINFLWRGNFQLRQEEKIKGETVDFFSNKHTRCVHQFLSISTSEEFVRENYIDHTHSMLKSWSVSKQKDNYSEKYDKVQKRYVLIISFTDLLTFIWNSVDVESK